MLQPPVALRPDTQQAGNSGVLLRMVGEDKVWPRRVEAQLQSGQAGDFWNIDEFPMKVAAARTNGRNTRRTHTQRAADRRSGTTTRSSSTAGDVTLIVNDEILNEAWDVEVIPGKICLQSEGAEIHFRDVRLAEIR